MKLLKKTMSFTLALLLVVSMLPVSASATEAEETTEAPALCSVTGCEKAAGHEGECTVGCTKTAGCTQKNGHTGDCTIPQTHAEGCTLGQTHEGDCVVCDGTANCPAADNHTTGCLKTAGTQDLSISEDAQLLNNSEGNGEDDDTQTQCNGTATCTAAEHAATCLTHCDETSVCDAKAHKETCKYYMDLQEEINDKLDSMSDWLEKETLSEEEQDAFESQMAYLDLFIEEMEIDLNEAQQAIYDSLEALANGDAGIDPQVSPEDAAASITAGSTTTYYETLQEAIDAAGASATTIELADGTHTLSAASGKNITIEGSANAVIEMFSAVNASGSTVSFKGVTVKFDNGNYEGLQHAAKVTYTGCKIYGTQFMYAPTAAFTNCTFEQADAATEYNVWTYGATNVTFKGCTFNTGGKAVLVYTEGEIHATVTLENCIFNDNDTLNTVKAAVEVGASARSTATTYKLNFKNCTVNGFAENNEGTPTGSKLWGNKNSMDFAHLNVVVDGKDKTTPEISATVGGEDVTSPIAAVEKVAGSDTPIVVKNDADTIEAIVTAAEGNSSVSASRPVEIRLPAATAETATVTEAVNAVSGSSKVALTVPVNGAQITFNSAAIGTIAGSSTSTPIVVSLDEVPESSKPATAPEDAVVYSITVTNNNTPVFTEGTTAEDASATVKLPVPTGMDDYAVYYYPTGRAKVKVNSTTEGSYAVFSVGHFSTYALEDAVAKVGDQGYATLQEAIAAAAPDSTIELLDDIVLTNFIILDDVNLDLNGNTISGEGYINIAGGTVKLSNGTITAKKIFSSSLTTNILINGTGPQVTLEDVTVQGGSYAVRVEKNASGVSLVTTNSTISGTDRGIMVWNNTDSTNSLTVNGGSITAPYAIDTYTSTENAAKIKITVNSGTIRGEGTSDDSYGITVRGDTGEISLDVKGGTISGDFGIAGNGSNSSAATVINVSNGTVTGADVGIYHPQAGTLAISGGTVQGKTGVEMRSGTLNVTGGIIKGSGTLKVTPNGNGSTTEGAAIAVAQHTTAKVIDVNISGGNIQASETGAAISVDNPQNTGANNVAVDITGGTFTGPVSVKKNAYGSGSEKIISGGAFDRAFDPALADDDFTPIQNADGSYGVAEKPDNGTDIESQKVTKTITMEWDDNNDEMKKRPKEVEIVLEAKTADGTKKTNYTLNPDTNGNWTLELKDLDLYTTPAAGSSEPPKYIEYSVKLADAIKNYTTTYETTGNAFKIINEINIVYEILKGAGQTVIYGSKAEFTSNGDYDKFVKLWVDDKEVAAEDRTVTKGSTVVTLDDDFVKELGVGTHSLTIQFSDGYASTTFKIKKPTPYHYNPDKLTQTGQLNWPIPVMATLGTAALAVGLWFLLETKKKHYES